MIILPFPARRHWLISFWLVMSSALGVLGVILLGLRGFPAWLASAAIAAILALPGLLRPNLALLPYRVWNKLARHIVSALRLLLMGLCFYTIFVVVRCRRAYRSALHLTSPHESLWVKRGTLPEGTYFSPYLAEAVQSEGHSWTWNFISSVRKSGEYWALSLLPFLLLLALLQTDEEQAQFPANLYTLF
jgi:hypothetical protein